MTSKLNTNFAIMTANQDKKEEGVERGIPKAKQISPAFEAASEITLIV